MIDIGWVAFDEFEAGNWPNCKTPDCPNKACIIMESEYCSPCSARRQNLTMDQWRKLIEQKRKDKGWDK